VNKKVPQCVGVGYPVLGNNHQFDREQDVTTK